MRRRCNGGLLLIDGHFAMVSDESTKNQKGFQSLTSERLGLLNAKRKRWRGPAGRPQGVPALCPFPEKAAPSRTAFVGVCDAEPLRTRLEPPPRHRREARAKKKQRGRFRNWNCG